MRFREHVRSFYASLDIKAKLPAKVDVLHPYHEPAAKKYCTQFYNKFYNDSNPRTIILGINPGRFGGGVTGIPFTDPVRLEKYCGIENDLNKKTELSSDFIYRMIEAFGGAEKFYATYFMSAVSPLGFTKDGKNLNYYDQKDLEVAVHDFIIQSIRKQLTFGINRETAFCLGEGQNFKFLRKLNAEHAFFKKIIPLPHPRFIMQYRRKQLDEFVALYLRTLT
jgi:hypothetical protein